MSVSQVRSAWDELETLHAAQIAHQRVDLDRVGVLDDSRVAFTELSSASVQCDVDDVLKDRAQLFALTLVRADQDDAIGQARLALGDDGFGAVLPYLQEAATPPLTRAALRKAHVGLDDVRKHCTELLGAPEPELVKLQHVTARSFLNLALFAFAAYTLIGMLGDIDFGSFFRALRDANWWWLAAALLVGQTPRVANTFSAMGSLEQPLPLGPTTQLQFASCYVNLAVPSSAGRIAITTRFYQRFGVPPAAALSAGVIDSVSELLVQLALFLSILFISDVDLGLSVSQEKLSGLATTALIVIGLLVVIVAVCLLVPKIRVRVFETARQVRDALKGAALTDQAHAALRRQPSVAVAVRRHLEHVCTGVRYVRTTQRADPDQLRRDALRRSPAGAGRCRRERGRTQSGLDPRRSPIVVGVRDRAGLPLRRVLPATAVGILESQVADSAALPVTISTGRPAARAAQI